MASKNVKFCSKSRKRFVQQKLSQQRAAETVPSADHVSMKRSSVPIREKQAVLENSENNTGQQFKQSDIAVSGCSGPATNVVDALVLKGRRIIDFAFFYEQVKELDSHSPRDAKCNFNTMKCYKEIHRGIASDFYFKCTVCGFDKHISSSRPEAKSSVEDINAASKKIGFNAAHFFATMKIPFLNSTEVGKQEEILERKE